jgi:sulfoxide reductase heme-binding subunit YedZ
VLGALSSQALWFLARGTGLVSLMLLTIAMVLGIVEIKRWTPRRWPLFVLAALHKNASLLAVVFLGVHIAATVVDGFAPIPWISAVVPFTSPYRPIWLALGAMAFDLILALVITSLLRSRLSYPSWKIVHWTAYACWPVAFVHGLGTGSDGTAQWVQATDIVCLVSVVAAIVWRLVDARQEHVERRLMAGAATAVFVILVLAWTVTGPGRPGWARRAGTPESLLGSPDAAEPDPTTPGPTAGDPSRGDPSTGAPTTVDPSAVEPGR